MKLREQVGLNIRNLRNSRGLSQEQLALAADLLFRNDSCHQILEWRHHGGGSTRGKAVEVVPGDEERAFLEAQFRRHKAPRPSPTAAGSSFRAPRGCEAGRSPGGSACTSTGSASGAGASPGSASRASRTSTAPDVPAWRPTARWRRSPAGRRTRCRRVRRTGRSGAWPGRRACRTRPCTGSGRRSA